MPPPHGHVNWPDEGAAGWLSLATWSWLAPMLATGFLRPLQPEDLGSLLSRDQARACVDRLSELIAGLRARGALTQYGLLSAVFRADAAVLWISGALKLVSTLLQFVGPLAIAGIIAYIEAAANGASLPSWGGLGLGYWWLMALVLAGFIGNLLRLHADMMQMRIALRGRSALVLAIYAKCTTVSAAALEAAGSGRVANMASSDAMMAALLLFFTHEVWRAPLVIALALASLYAQLGAPAFVALGACVALSPAQFVVGAWVGHHYGAAAGLADARVRLLTEAVGNMKALKLLAAEAGFGARISKLRAAELTARRRVAIISGG